MIKAVVVRLEWSLQNGLAEFSPVYNDGTMGSVVPTFLALSGRPLAAQKAAMAVLEERWVGKEKS